MSLIHRRRRMASLATAATLAMALPAAGTAILASPAQSADPVSDCVEAFPVDEVVAGAPVDGLTVVQGTTPTGFTGEVLGVIDDGVALDVDMIMVDIDMPAFASTGGVWQGMSGSPVYAADGRLLGAVAYGLAYGPSPIAGITPFAEMDDYLDAESVAPRVGLGKADARTVAARAGISTAQASQGFRELPMPMGITGVPVRRLAQLQAKGPDFLEKSTYVIGRATTADAGAETIVAGGNMAVSAAYGDISFAGVGTATSVCDGRVVGFGHPLALLGSTTLGLHPADAVYVQPDPVSAPFKVANISPAVGTVTDDRLTGVTGFFGAAPASAEIASTVTYGSRSRTGRTAVSVPDFAADVTFYQLIANQDRVVDGPSNGSELMAWRITGTEKGKPFTLSYTDRHTGSDLAFEATYGLADLIYYLGSRDDVTLGSVTAQVDVTDGRERHSLIAVEQRRGGQWTRVTRKAPAVGRAGKEIRLRVVIGGTAGKRILPMKPVTLPKKAKGTLVLAVQGGDGMWSNASGDTVAQLRASLAKQLRHDQVRVQVGTRDKIEIGYGDEEYYRTRARGVSFVRTQTTAPLAHVVDGSRILPVVVR